MSIAVSVNAHSVVRIISVPLNINFLAILSKQNGARIARESSMDEFVLDAEWILVRGILGAPNSKGGEGEFQYGNGVNIRCSMTCAKAERGSCGLRKATTILWVSLYRGRGAC